MWGYKDFYTVVFKDFDDTILKTEQVPYNESATAPSNPIRTGYPFKGWDMEFTNVTSDLTIYALYERLILIVFFNTNGCEPIESILVYYNDTISLPIPIKEGFNFKGWLLNGIIFTSSTPVTENITLDALWEESIE